MDDSFNIISDFMIFAVIGQEGRWSFFNVCHASLIGYLPLFWLCTELMIEVSSINIDGHTGRYVTCMNVPLQPLATTKSTAQTSSFHKSVHLRDEIQNSIFRMFSNQKQNKHIRNTNFLQYNRSHP